MYNFSFLNSLFRVSFFLHQVLVSSVAIKMCRDWPSTAHPTCGILTGIVKIFKHQLGLRDLGAIHFRSR